MSLVSAAISLSFAVGGMLLAQVDTDAPATPQLAFEVASIRQNMTLGGRNHIYNDPHNGEFRTANAPLKMILEYAYGLPQTQIVGGPAWVDSAKFDIDAKGEPAVSEALAKMESTAGREAKRGMVRALLEDRFGLVAHKETREMPVYELVAAKGGLKGAKSDEGGTTENDGKGHIYVQGSDDTVGLLCESLSRALGRVVVNKTGLQGRYKLDLKWTPDDVQAAGGGGADAPPDVFTAIQEQLGLKLEPAKGEVPVLAIDKVTMPTEN